MAKLLGKIKKHIVAISAVSLAGLGGFYFLSRKASAKPIIPVPKPIVLPITIGVSGSQIPLLQTSTTSTSPVDLFVKDLGSNPLIHIINAEYAHEIGFTDGVSAATINIDVSNDKITWTNVYVDPGPQNYVWNRETISANIGINARYIRFSGYTINSRNPLNFKLFYMKVS